MNYRSDEEKYFSWWLDELQELELIKGYDYENKEWSLSPPITIFHEKHLKTKIKTEERSILKSHSYGCDFTIYPLSESFGRIFAMMDVPVKVVLPYLYGSHHNIYVEIKPIFDKNNMTREFAINRKWVYEKYGDFVNLVKIGNTKNSFFSKTFTPRRFLLTDKTNKPRSLKYTPVMIEDYLIELEGKYSKLRSTTQLFK
jgi:hypothetical protein